MKSLIIGLALFAVAPAFAKSHRAPKDCSPIIKHTAGDEGEAYYVYPCGPNAPITHRGCTEGEIAYSTEMGPSGEYVNVTVVCHNGSFGNPGSNVHRSCNEGEIAYSNEYGAGGELEQVTVVCKNGHFVRR